MAKGGKPVIRKIDHVDLLILDEIRGYSERGGGDCFIGAVQLAENLGLWDREKEVADRVLQLVALGFVHAKFKFYDGKRLPRLVLSIDSELINNVLSVRKELILSSKRMDSLPSKILDGSKDFLLLQEYIKEYKQEYIQEDLQEHLQEDVQENVPAGADCEAVSCMKPTEKDGREEYHSSYSFIDHKDMVGSTATKAAAHTSHNKNNNAEYIQGDTDREDSPKRVETTEVSPVPISKENNKPERQKGYYDYPGWPEHLLPPQPAEPSDIDSLLLEAWELITGKLESGATERELSHKLFEATKYCDVEYIKCCTGRKKHLVEAALEYLRSMRREPGERYIDYSEMNDLPF